jgi:uncharacterized OB-fold protein/acyl dehydratase
MTDTLDTTPDAFQARLQAFEGRPVGPPTVAPDEVNQAMIRHWVEAMGDENPVYLDEEAARANGFPGVVAPATMLQAWVMRGLRASLEADRARAEGSTADPTAYDELFLLLDGAGFTSVVATNCDQDYRRPLVLGDRLTATAVIEAVSAQKQTGLGDGHFVTTRLDFTDAAGAEVATMRFRILRFKPKPVTAEAPPAGTDAPRPRRPRPALTEDIAFFFEGAKEGKLLIQRCASCGKLRHPPLPACPHCRSFDWDTVESTGRGTVFSFVVTHYPQVPGFDYPLPIAVVELEEGTRIVAGLTGIDVGAIEIGMAVEVELVAVDEDLTLPMFRPAGPAATGAR